MARGAGTDVRTPWRLYWPSRAKSSAWVRIKCDKSHADRSSETLKSIRRLGMLLLHKAGFREITMAKLPGHQFPPDLP